MRMKTTVWYTLGEAEKATGIQRTRLDHACRVGRLPYRRSETGARLLSHDVVEKLRKEGLKSFPRPYDPIASSNEQVASPAGVTQGMGPAAQRERVEQKRGELEELRIDRDLRQQRQKERQEKAERRVAAAAERQAQAEERAHAQRQRQQIRLEEARQAEAREQAARETEARHRRQQWEIYWLACALELLPSDVPHSFELDVHQVVADLLPKLDAQQPEQLTKRLIQAAIDRALQPWHRRKEIEKIIEQARNQLPVLVRSWTSTPNEWDARAMRAAADAIAQLGYETPLAELCAAAVEAGNKVRAEYVTWKASEDHRLACEQMVQCVMTETTPAKRFDRLWRSCLSEPLAQRWKMHATQRWLLSERQRRLPRTRIVICCTCTLISTNLAGEWELGEWSERYELAKRLTIKLRPILTRWLTDEPPDDSQARRRIEKWIVRELESED
jgi:hypothetical protein